MNASKITAGTFVDARIPNLNASKITAGTFVDARIPNLATSKITSGTFVVARIPDLNASKIDAGTFGAGNYTFPALLTVNSTIAGVSQTLSGNIRVGSGTNTAPTFSFTADVDTGMYLAVNPGILGFTVVGVLKLRILATAIEPFTKINCDAQSTGRLVLPVGTDQWAT